MHGIKDDKCRKETGKEGKSYLPQEDQGKSLVLLLPKAKKIEVRKTRLIDSVFFGFQYANNHQRFVFIVVDLVIITYEETQGIIIIIFYFLFCNVLQIINFIRESSMPPKTM